MIDIEKLAADVVVALDKVDDVERSLEPLLSLAPNDINAKIADAMTALRAVLSTIHGQATLAGVAEAEAAADAKEAAKFPLPEGLVHSEFPPKG